MSDEVVRLRLAEGDARVVLLIEAVEETDEHGALLAQSALAAATRRALETSSSRGGDDHALRARALLLWNDLATTAPELGHILGPTRLRRPLALTIVAAAACGGALANALGPERQVSVLAFPLAGILLWNLAVYAALAVRTLASAALRDRATALGARGVGAVARWLESVRLSDHGRQSGRQSGTARSAAVARAARRFGGLW